jgi:hypothetical protein
MSQRLALGLMGLALALTVPACAPKLVGPTAGSGYVFSLQTYPTIIWVGQVDSTLAAQFPQVAEVIMLCKTPRGERLMGCL